MTQSGRDPAERGPWPFPDPMQPLIRNSGAPVGLSVPHVMYVRSHSPEWLFDGFLIMSTSRRLIFAVVAMFSAAVGITGLVKLHSEVSADTKAYISKVVIQSLQRVGPKAEEHRRIDHRLPTDDEVICDWEPCPPHTLRLWHVAAEGDGGFSLTFYNAPALLMPGAPFATTWHSRDGTTDLDGWDNPLRWRVDYYRRLVIDFAIILMPWVWPLWRWSRKRHSVAPARAAPPRLS
jgi:hypothetical protein